ncbi:hypothetical protein BV898_02997 [Hypsibius exemplaris]|uniref:Uncharacterized protein n=1 Tax=Hypsibius exemplaris TaxID=2072580 RepID=A0A1W0X644_HYPEX|nr:hypothetical protein BV898_02997 [Hypsibius exemplaris]
MGVVDDLIRKYVVLFAFQEFFKQPDRDMWMRAENTSRISPFESEHYCVVLKILMISFPLFVVPPDDQFTFRSHIPNLSKANAMSSFRAWSNTLNTDVSVRARTTNADGSFPDTAIGELVAKNSKNATLQAIAANVLSGNDIVKGVTKRLSGNCAYVIESPSAAKEIQLNPGKLNRAGGSLA